MTTTMTTRHRGGGEVPRHRGIICDGCNTRDFTGVRYKCLSCPDFDLCGECHSRRDTVHPEHDFETIVTPRSPVPPFLQDFLSRATGVSIGITFIGLHAAEQVSSGLDDSRVAWWLADSRRIVHEADVSALDPPWMCPICAEGVEAESSNGWVVQICGSDIKEMSTPASPSGDVGSGGPPTARNAEDEEVDQVVAWSADTAAASSSSSTAGPARGGGVQIHGKEESPRALGEQEEEEEEERRPAEAEEQEGSADGQKDMATVAREFLDCDSEAAREAARERSVTRLDPQGHVYHEMCLRRWLVKRNSCPVCRRTPVVTEDPST